MSTSITVSERAARRIGEILKGEPTGTMLRVSVEGGGCSGFQYKFDMERAKAADDLVISRDGAVVLIDPVSVNYMAGSEIDFVDDLIGAVVQGEKPEGEGVLRLRHQLLALISSERRLFVRRNPLTHSKVYSAATAGRTSAAPALPQAAARAGA